MEREKHPPADLLGAIVSGIPGVLGDDLAALWLYGSSVAGGFDPGISDIDLAAATSSDIEAIDLGGLERMHHGLIRRYPDWEERIEVVYLSRATLETFRTSAGALAVISPGEPFHVRDDRAADLASELVSRSGDRDMPPRTRARSNHPADHVDRVRRRNRAVHR